jgi:hypothetical protein
MQKTFGTEACGFWVASAAIASMQKNFQDGTCGFGYCLAIN